MLESEVKKLTRQAEIEKATADFKVRLAELEAQNKAQASVMGNFERGIYMLGTPASSSSDASSPLL